MSGKENMMSRTSSQTFEFSTFSKWLHWGGMFLVILLIIAGTIMVNLDDGSPQRALIYRLHGIIGMLIVLSTLARIVIRLRHSQSIPEGMTDKWNIWLHGIVQWGMYLVMLGLGISGTATLALNNTTAFTVDPSILDRTIATVQGHFVLTRLFIVLVVLHVAGVMRHQLTRSDVLRRMGLNTPLGKSKN